jgi:retron-type reverse transcriptase
MAVDIEWEAYFEPNSYGFRLGWSYQDVAIKVIFLTIQANCLNKIN